MVRVAIWLVPIALLLIALLDMPYGYYQLLRVCIFCTSAYIAVQQNKRNPNFWMWGFVACALIYNPVIKMSLGKEIWPLVNIATIVLYFSHMMAERRLKNVFRGEL